MRTEVAYMLKYYRYPDPGTEPTEGKVMALNKLDLKNKILTQIGIIHLVALKKYRIGKDDFVELKVTLPRKTYKNAKLFPKKDLLLS